ncbi:hypothetical protein FACS1894195_5450 [Bacteroidia bacterium]|nr:hypothetical protein FACS1894195_5450 [Bacteroidia bacterium]
MWAIRGVEPLLDYNFMISTLSADVQAANIGHGTKAGLLSFAKNILAQGVMSLEIFCSFAVEI